MDFITTREIMKQRVSDSKVLKLFYKAGYRYHMKHMIRLFETSKSKYNIVKKIDIIEFYKFIIAIDEVDRNEYIYIEDDSSYDRPAISFYSDNFEHKVKVDTSFPDEDEMRVLSKNNENYNTYSTSALNSDTIDGVLVYDRMVDVVIRYLELGLGE
jgi:hypothetical protein